MAIYFLEAVGLSKVKIGFSDDPPRRIGDLAVACPVPVKLFGVIDGTRDDEAGWHSRWDAARSHGEWFFVTRELKCAINDACGRGETTIIGEVRNVWVFQDRKQRDKYGDSAKWSVGWYDNSGNRKGRTIGTRDEAEKFREIFQTRLNKHNGPRLSGE